MKAFVLAAGLGTRLKPWTLHHPKALVPVGGTPMLERVLTRLTDEGFDDITINVHHFADQIRDYLSCHKFDADIHVSDESGRLLDTGGGLLAASEWLGRDDRPFLVHNVDILSDAPLAGFMNMHGKSGRDVTLLTSARESSRKLIFQPDGTLAGWHNTKSGEYRPGSFVKCPDMHESAFSGIYIVEPRIFASMQAYAAGRGSAVFPIMDYLLASVQKQDIGEIRLDSLNLIDIGKPETLARAEALLSRR